jgi:hypothetical protein
MGYYGHTQYLADKEFLARMRDVARGNLDLSWLEAAKQSVAVRPTNKKRGLTYLDCNVGEVGYDALPEVARDNRGMATRGAQIPSDVDMPDLGASINRKSEVWAYKVASYYEEAMSRQWNATTDVPWAELQKHEVPEEIELAFCQLCTLLTEVELIATDLPAKWVWRMNSDYQEVKNFIASQAMDEARHAEVFRKRCLANGVGLLRASPSNEHALKGILEGDSYSEASVFMHLLAEGFVLTMFRFSEFISPTPVDKRMFQLVMQDEARHVSYGLQHLKYVLDTVPEKREQIHAALDEAENHIFGTFSPEFSEALVILAGKGSRPANIRKGLEIFGCFQQKQIEEYLARCARAGMPERKERSRFVEFAEAMGANVAGSSTKTASAP